MRLLLALTLFCAALPAWALDASPAVKVSSVLKTSTDWHGQALHYPSGQAQITGLIVEIAPGGETGWHQHPVPSFGTLLDGDLDIALKDGSVNHLHKGDYFEEVQNTLHNGHNVGAVPVKILVFYAGAVDQALTVKEGVTP